MSLSQFARRFLGLACLVMAVVLSAPNPAGAMNFSISTKMNVTDVAGACNSAGGVFSFADDGASYGCSKANCDGKGSTTQNDGHQCRITCTNDQKCTGSTPSIIANPTILGILQNGDNVNHNYGAAEQSNTPNHPTDTGAPKQGGQVGGPSFL